MIEDIAGDLGSVRNLLPAKVIMIVKLGTGLRSFNDSFTVRVTMATALCGGSRHTFVYSGPSTLQALVLHQLQNKAT